MTALDVLTPPLFTASVAFAISQNADWTDCCFLTAADPSSAQPFVGPYDGGTVYAEGDVVVSGGFYFRALFAVQNIAPPAACWTPVLTLLRKRLMALSLDGDASLQAVIAPDPNFSTTIATLSTAAGSLKIADPINGLIAFFVPSAVIATWPTGAFYIIVRLIKAGIVKDIMRGPISIYPRLFT